jgi:hypothetical protein
MLVQSKRNGILLVTAKGERSDQAAILLACLCVMATAIAALFALPALAPGGTLSAAAVYGPMFQTAIILLLGFVSISKRRRRRSIEEALRARYPHT